MEVESSVYISGNLIFSWKKKKKDREKRIEKEEMEGRMRDRIIERKRKNK
jgi:hypothetical protein